MQSLIRVFAVLDALIADDLGGLGVRELSAALKLPKSTVGRILTFMMERGLTAQDPATRRYSLGPMAATLGQAYAKGTDIIRLSRDDMLKLRDLTGETVSLNVKSGWARVCVAQIESQNELRAAGEIGHVYPLDSGAPGRILLHSMTESEIAYVLNNRELLCDYPRNNPMGDKQVSRSLQSISREGYAIADQETMRGVCSISVAVRGANDIVLAALGLLVPHDRFAKAKQARLIDAVRAAATSIERRLGRTDDSHRTSYPSHATGRAIVLSTKTAVV